MEFEDQKSTIEVKSLNKGTEEQSKENGIWPKNGTVSRKSAKLRKHRSSIDSIAKSVLDKIGLKETSGIRDNQNELHPVKHNTSLELPKILPKAGMGSIIEEYDMRIGRMEDKIDNLTAI